MSFDADKHAGDLPLNEVVAASSAALGTTPILRTNREYSLHNFAVFSTERQGANAFATAKTILRKTSNVNQKFRDAAAKGLHAVIDGVYTDNSGIIHAIAAGADEVVAFVGGTKDVRRMFQKTTQYAELNGDPWKSADTWSGGHFRYHKIFKEDASIFDREFRKFGELNVGSSKHIKSIKYGTLMVKTVDCEEFGIAAGRQITIKLTAIDSSLRIVLDHPNYSQAVREIAMIIRNNDNRAHAANLLSFMTGAEVPL